jgi:integrase
MRGSLRQRRPGSWELRIHAGRNETTGKAMYVSRTVRGDRDTAQRALAALVAQVTDSPTSPTFGTVGELCDKWWRYSSPNLAPTVAREYRRIIDQRLIPTLGHLRLADLRPNRLDAWYAELLATGAVTGKPLSANSVRRIHAVLHTAIEQGVAWDWIGHNPVRHASPPPARRSRLHLPSAEEVNNLIAAAANINPDLPLMFRLAAVTGARRGELCALQWQHVDTTRRTLHIAGQIAHTPTGPVQRPTKTHAERRLTLDQVTIDELHRLRSSRPPDGAAADRYIFSHTPDATRPWRPDYVTLAFARLAAQLGIPDIRLHDLRHFAATTMLLNGIDVRTAAGRLGHARASTTLDIYAHYTQPADQRASDTLANSLKPPTQRLDREATGEE